MTEPNAPDGPRDRHTKICPYCREEIRDDAVKCRYCQSMLLPDQRPASTGEDANVTYVVDRGLIRFAKFAAANLAILVVVGAYLFGFKLDSALQELSEMRAKLVVAKAQLDSAQTTTSGLKREVERVLAQVRRDADTISLKGTQVGDLIRDLTSQQQRAKAAAAANHPEKVRLGAKGKLWAVGATIRIRFLTGTAAAKARVMTIASTWTTYANLRFQVVESGDAEVRIGMDPDDGSWSYVGTDALGVAQSEKSMNLAATDRQTILHEFGHVLGLIHEHQNPNANIPWNRSALAVYYAGPPNFWSNEDIEYLIVRKESVDSLPPYRKFDAESIMAFDYPPSLTGGMKIGGGSDLTVSDKQFVATLYPGR